MLLSYLDLAAGLCVLKAALPTTHKGSLTAPTTTITVNSLVEAVGVRVSMYVAFHHVWCMCIYAFTLSSIYIYK